MSILDNVRTAVTSQTAEKLFLLKQSSPKLMFGIGVAGFVGTVALACRATLKLQPVLTELDENLDDMKTDLEQDNISQADYDKHVRTARLHAAGDIAKLYAIPTIVGVASIAALTGSHVVLSKQNAAALASFKAMETAYQRYRQRVATEYGEDVDRRFANNQKVVEVEVQKADGTVEVVEEYYPDPDGLSPYSVLFSSETSKFFGRMPHENEMLLSMKMAWANDKLNAKGYLFLNDVREMLGMEAVPEGQLVGWLAESHPGHKDGFVSFGLFDGDPEEYEKFLAGRSPYVTLDFNVDGEIHTKIGRKNPKLYAKK